MNSKCIVFDCANVEGTLIPQDPEISEKLLGVFGLDRSACTPGSFICFAHLEQGFPQVSVGEAVTNPMEYCSDENVFANEDQSSAEKVQPVTEDKLCRVCLSKQYLNINIFDFIEEDITIASALMDCAHPLKIVEDDMPKFICESCLETLKMAYKFRKKCIVTDQILQIRSHRRKRQSLPLECEEKHHKRSKHNEVSINIVKPETGLEVMYQEDDNDTLKNENIPVSKKCNESVFNTNKLLVMNKYNIDEVERNMEVLHSGALENVDEPSVKDILNILGDDVENQNIVNEFLVKNVSSSSSQQKIIIKPTTSNKSLEISNKKLPQSLKIKRVPSYKSTIGNFKGTIKVGVHESIFIQVDGYLFEYGLLKKSMRHLRCTVPNCSAIGKQELLPNGECDETVQILNPHNHEPPTEDTVRKQMFLCWMRKRMQNDKTLNIRNIYEDACFQDPDIKQVIPLRNVVNEICRHQLTQKISHMTSFEMFYKMIETDAFDKLHFTHSNEQFYQEKFYVDEDESMAVLFANTAIIEQLSDSQIMYVDASFKIDTNEDFKYQLLTVLVWIDDSYFPVLFAIVNKKSQLLFRRIFTYLYEELAPDLRPQEIVTDYEANIYYALAEIYTNSSIGGSVFYYTQNLYKTLCTLNLSRDLETNSYFRNIYHMLLMLPLLPVNTILDGLNTIETEAKALNISQLVRPLFDHVRTQWILNVTPELFCVHKLESRINENVIAPFKKLRDFLLLTKGKGQKIQITITYVIEKLIELEHFLRGTYSKSDKKSFGRDLSSSQKKNVLRAWQYIEEHPKIEMNNFFAKVLGYIKCMENQLWIWGFYRYGGDTDDILINASHFSIELQDDENQVDDELEYMQIPGNTIVMEAVIDQNGILQPHETLDKEIEGEGV